MNSRNIQEEEHVAGLFCGYLGKVWEIDRSHRESPDFVLHSGERKIGLELTQLRQEGAQDRALDYERALGREVLTQWLSDPCVHHYEPWLKFRLRGGKYLVPPPKERPKFIEELKGLVAKVASANAEFVTVLFRGDHPVAADHPCASTYRFVDGDNYPTLYRCAEEVRFVYFPTPVGFPSSNLHVGYGYAGDVLTPIKKKRSKLSIYRNKLPGIELHLLLWTSGEYGTRRVPDEYIDDIKNKVGATEAAHTPEERFDCIWFGSDLLMRTVGRKGHIFVKLT